MARFDRFTERARKVLTLAQEEARRLNHNDIDTDPCCSPSRARAMASLASGRALG